MVITSGSSSSYPDALVPLFVMTRPNEEVLLWDGGVRIVCPPAVEADFEGTISLVWLPTMRIAFDVACDDFPDPPIGVGLRIAPLDAYPEDVEGVITRLTARFSHASAGTTATGHLTEMTFRGSGKAERVVFALANFPHYVGESVRHPSGAFASSRVLLEDDDWRITIDGVASLSEQIKLLRESGGFVITHVGEVIRRDSQPIDSSDIEPLLNALLRLFSFARGGWNAPLLATGMDGSGDRIWQQWGPWLVDAWSPVTNWFPCHQGGALSKVFGPFMERWNDSLWREALETVLYWYIQANNLRSPETSITLGQVGLELLGWVSLVQDRALVSPKEFDKLPAQDKLRLLLSDAGVPLAIPVELGELTSLAAVHSWVDGPHAVTALRNALVHPSFKNRQRVLTSSPGARFEAATLAVWYLELVLLRLFAYDGEYTNRITAQWAGDVERVPWA